MRKACAGSVDEAAVRRVGSSVALTVGAAVVLAGTALRADPATPSRQDVVRAMNAVAPRVRRCMGSAPSVRVRVVFVNTGEVIQVDFDDAIQSDPDKSQMTDCIRAAVLDARVPRFTQPNFRVAYPFRNR